MFSEFFFFFNDTATTEIYTLSLHDALPIFRPGGSTRNKRPASSISRAVTISKWAARARCPAATTHFDMVDRKSTRLNSSHANISYAVFCLKKKKYGERWEIFSRIALTVRRS